MKIQKIKTCLLLFLAALLVFAVGSVGAQEGQKKPEPPYSKPYPIGQVTIEMKGVGVGIGIEWGTGVLTYKGKQYTFKIKGLQLVTVGITKAKAKGDVYNLFSLGEFSGQYVAATAGAALIKGKERNDFVNPKGVHIILEAEQKGVELKIGPEGFKIKMEEAL
ncbi:MAG: hypothetical protein PHU44_09160 [Syntrophales bacterium]|nr:hypothetical protein [Syntrophales bacterium]MDD5642668.1 hypothetical protein [Syntrophales bacterium]